MNIPSIKQLANKAPVDQVQGTIEKQYPPKDPTPKDIEFGQHMQSLLINDGSGEKLMVTLMKEQLHILDSCEGNEIIICSTINDKGDPRGIVFNTWQPQGKSYPNTSVRVYPEATIRVVPAGGATQQPVQKQEQAPTQSQPQDSSGLTEFDKEIALCALGYCKCLDTAELIIADRPLLATDGESLRAIATNLWMSSKHRVSTIAPEVMGSSKPINRGAPAPASPSPDPAPKKAPASASVKKLNDMEIVKKVIAGHAANEADKLDDNGKAYLALVDAEIDDRDLWADAYDELCSNNFLDNKVAVDSIFDATAKMTGAKSPEVEKFIIGTQAAWREEVLEEIGRNS
tara:strand:- start:7047 stop:8078 length:1032 start_codon:yes stop_codon:yes gene_type:complete